MQTAKGIKILLVDDEPVNEGSMVHVWLPQQPLAE